MRESSLPGSNVCTAKCSNNMTVNTAEAALLSVTYDHLSLPTMTHKTSLTRGWCKAHAHISMLLLSGGLYFRLFTKILYITLYFGVWDPCLHFSSLQVRLSKCGPTYKVFQTYGKADLAPNRKETKCQVGDRQCVSVPSHWVEFCCRFICNIRTTSRLYLGFPMWTTNPHSVTAWIMLELP